MLGAVGEVGLYVGPFFVGAVTEALKIDAAMAGVLFGAEILISAITAVAVSSNLAKLPGRMTMAAAIVFIILGDLASFFVTSYSALFISRVTAAIGAGTVFAGANAMAASTESPGKTYTAIGVIALLYAIAAFFLIPAGQKSFGPKVVFLVLVVLATPGVFFIKRLPAFYTTGACQARLDGALTDLLSPRVLSALVVVLFMYLGSNGLWAYMERIGVEVNLLSPERVGNVLICAASVAATAPILASLAARRIGLRPAVLAGLLIQALSSLTVVYFRENLIFSVMAILLTTFLIFVLTLAKISMAEGDPSGRVVGTATGLITIGSGVGPVLGGGLLSYGGGYSSLGWMAATCMIVSMFAAMVAFRNGSHRVV